MRIKHSFSLHIPKGSFPSFNPEQNKPAGRCARNKISGLPPFVGGTPKEAFRRTVFFSLSLLAFLVLASCSSQPTAAPTASPSPLQTLIPTVSSTEAGCTAVKTEPTPNVSSALPAITSTDYVSGPTNAPVTLLTYCDFQSPGCQGFAGILDALRKNHLDDLRIVFRPVPAINYIKDLDKTQISVQAALAAGDQGKFWELRDVLVGQYTQWIKLSPTAFKSWVTGQAAELGLDGAKFDTDFKSSETQARAKALYDTAHQLNLSIPIAFINGTPQMPYVLDYASLDSTIGLTALGAKQFKACPPFGVDPTKQYTATIRLAKGNIVIQLYADKAPLAVNSFVFLARSGWFNGTTFHRVIPGFLAQTGDPSGTGRGGPGYFFKNEISSDLLYDRPGVVGMANSGADTNGSQFFITYAPEPQLDGGYTVFGQVLNGMDVVESLTPRDPSQSANLPPGDKILDITVEEK